MCNWDSELKQHLHHVSCGAQEVDTLIARVICWKSDTWNKPAQVVELLDIRETPVWNIDMNSNYRDENIQSFPAKSSAAPYIRPRLASLHIFPDLLEEPVATQSWMCFMLWLMHCKTKVNRKKWNHDRKQNYFNLKIRLLHWGSLLSDGSLPEHVAVFIGYW
jgi:hypothetical protein